MKTSQKNYEEALKEWKRQQDEAREAGEYLANHQQDALLEQKKVNWELRRSMICKDKASLDSLKLEIKKMQGKLEKADETKAALDAQADVEANLRVDLDGLLGGKTRQDIQNAWAAAGNLNDFFRGETRRDEFLKPNTRCPLCGSKEHPYCEGVEPPADDDFETMVAELQHRL